MPYLPVLADWIQQSTYLLQARPTTTRITSRYSFVQPSSTSSKKRKRESERQVTEATETAGGPRAELKVRAFDPESGACLMYKTDQAAEVKQLLRSLGRLGRVMAALPEILEEPAAALDVPEQQIATGSQTPVGDPAVKANKDGKPQAAEAGGKKKKKKGKK